MDWVDDACSNEPLLSPWSPFSRHWFWFIPVIINQAPRIHAGPEGFEQGAACVILVCPIVFLWQTLASVDGDNYEINCLLCGMGVQGDE